MTLDPKAKALLTAIAAAGEPAIDTVPLELAREQVENGYARMKIPVMKVGSIINVAFPVGGEDIPVRIYIPDGKGPFPLMVFFHGGGWVFFHLDAYDSICTHLCAMANCVVVSVGYRRSPEYKFPVAIDDCLAATRWAGKQCKDWNGDPGNIFLAGDSAGGNLAAVVAMRIRDEGGPVIKGQILIYPVTDYYLPEKPSFKEFSDGYGLTRDALKWFWDKYLEKDEDTTNPMIAPLQAGNLSELPPSLVIISGYDPLRDEGVAYANRMKEAGNTVKISLYEDMIHGFISYLGILSHAKTALKEISTWVINTLNESAKY